MLSDILPTGFECGVLNGQVKPGDTVAIVGAGPIGLAVLLTAQFYSPAAVMMIDLDDNRLRVAKDFGATTLINSADGKAVERVLELTGGEGVDVAVEAVGMPATFDICQSILAPGGHLANVGVHGKAGGAACREALGSQHHADHQARRYRDDADAAEGGRLGQIATEQARDAPLRPR